MSTEDAPPSCRESCAAAGEPLRATAADALAVTVVVEDGGRWGPKALVDSELPAAVQERLIGLKASGRARVLLVRSGRSGPAGRRVWIARGLPGEEALWCWTLDRAEDLLDLPLEALIAGQEEGPRVAGPLVLVCTHGQRDRCCAVEGGPVYAALAAVDPDAVLRSSHLGGHRFAATALVLPEGLMYGRLTPDDAVPLLEAARARRIYRLDRYRGRSSWGRPVQAALHQWREDSGVLDYDGVHVLGRIRLGEDRWRVALSTAGSGPAYCEYEVSQVTLDQPVLKSCGDAAPAPASAFTARRVG